MHPNSDPANRMTSFEQIQAYIMDDVIIGKNIGVTSYFPSMDKLKRLFALYAQQATSQSEPQCIQTNDSNKRKALKHTNDLEVLKQMSQKDLEQFILAFIIITQQKSNTQTITLNKHQQQMEFSLKLPNKPRNEAHSLWTIHRQNLTKLIEFLLKQKNLHGNQKVADQVLYDFNTIQIDERSIQMPKKTQLLKQKNSKQF